jgi:putative transposase
MIKKNFQADLYRCIGEIAKNKKWLILAVGGVCDHIHILIKMSPSDAIKDVVRVLKSNSSKFIRDNFDAVFAWQEGYSVFSVDERCLENIKNYVLNQEMRHRKD